ncbi:Inner tegument protein [Dirofilaria immitis]
MIQLHRHSDVNSNSDNVTTVVKIRIKGFLEIGLSDAEFSILFYDQVPITKRYNEFVSSIAVKIQILFFG